VGETNYIDKRILNFVGLSYLGHVNIHRDYLKSALSFAAAAYGALHIAAWNEFYPTETERILWITSAMTIGSSGILLWLYFLARQRVQSLDFLAVRVKSKKGLKVVGQIAFGLFVLARVYLVVEAFVSLRRVPKAVYQTPEWSEYLPHF
jgi:hypothetical protein